MYFPIADVTVSPLLLALLGIVVGTMTGFFGVGGGFLITGGLLVLGVPTIYAVGTGLLMVMGTAITSTLRHRRLGNVDLRLAVLIVCGTIPGVFLGERVNSALEAGRHIRAGGRRGLFRAVAQPGIPDGGVTGCGDCATARCVGI